MAEEMQVEQGEAPEGSGSAGPEAGKEAPGERADVPNGAVSEASEGLVIGLAEVADSGNPAANGASSAPGAGQQAAGPSDRPRIPMQDAAPPVAPPAEPSARALGFRARAQRGVVLLLFRRAVVTSALAIAALIASFDFGGVLGPSGHHPLLHIIGIVCAVVFLGTAVVAVRAATTDVITLASVPGRLGDARSGTLRLMCLLAGYLVVVFGGMSLLRVPVEHLLLGGVLTGVILGIAAQQVLANIFAGLVILFARPFTIGDELAIRSGALGGPVIGTVTGMTLTYVTVLTGVGPVLLPNSAVLAAAIGPATAWPMP